MVIIVDGTSAQRGAIAARLAVLLGVDCFTGGEMPCAGLREGLSCVIAPEGTLPDIGGCLRVFLHDGEAQHDHLSGCPLCLDAQVLGVNGSAELIKQFAVQRLMLRRASSRRV